MHRCQSPQFRAPTQKDYPLFRSGSKLIFRRCPVALANRSRVVKEQSELYCVKCAWYAAFPRTGQPTKIHPGGSRMTRSTWILAAVAASTLASSALTQQGDAPRNDLP